MKLRATVNVTIIYYISVKVLKSAKIQNNGDTNDDNIFLNFSNDKSF